MNIPNIEKKAFRDMTAEERSGVVEARIRGVVDIFNPEYGTWGTAFAPSIRIDGIYRTRQRKLEIPWGHIKPEFKWAAMDENGDVWAYSTEPFAVGDRKGNWCGDDFHKISSILNIDTSGIDWRESLTQRPEN